MDLTGIKEVDKLILFNLDDKSLCKVALVNTYINSLLDEQLWADRFNNKYGFSLWKYKVSHEFIYKEFSKLQGEELLMRVIDYNFIELLESLLEGSNKEKLLIYAVNGHVDVVELLLNSGANIHYENDKALVIASKLGHVDIIMLLVDRGANIFTAEALQWASLGGRLELVNLLLDKGADIHSYKDGALYWAIQNGDLKVIELLLDRSNTVNNKSLMWACEKGNIEIVKLLLERGVDVDINDRTIICAAEKVI